MAKQIFDHLREILENSSKAAGNFEDGQRFLSARVRNDFQILYRFRASPTHLASALLGKATARWP
jgi:hypothetical protein